MDGYRYFPENGWCLRLQTSPTLSFYEAQAWCIDNGTRLAVIDTILKRDQMFLTIKTEHGGKV